MYNDRGMTGIRGRYWIMRTLLIKNHPTESKTALFTVRVGIRDMVGGRATENTVCTVLKLCNVLIIHKNEALCAGHEEQLIPFSLVQMVEVSSKRPVVFSPSLLSCGIIERLMQPAESGQDFDICHPGTAPLI